MTQRLLPLIAGFMVAAALSGCTAGETAKAADQASMQVQTPAVSTPVSEAEETRRNEDPAVCASAGGTLRRVGLGARPWCVIPSADAGKVCHDKADCAGACILNSEKKPTGPVEGVCQATNVQFGCFARIENGQAQPVLCVD